MDAALLLPLHTTIYPREEIKVRLELRSRAIPKQIALVVVAMSGGVDSSVTAALLAQNVI